MHACMRLNLAWPYWIAREVSGCDIPCYCVHVPSEIEARMRFVNISNTALFVFVACKTEWLERDRSAPVVSHRRLSLHSNTSGATRF